MGVEVKGDEIDDLWRAAGGKGTDAKSSIDMRALEGKLFSIGRLHKAATLKRLHKAGKKPSKAKKLPHGLPTQNSVPLPILRRGADVLASSETRYECGRGDE